jgi:hypothetical protein
MSALLWCKKLHILKDIDRVGYFFIEMEKIERGTSNAVQGKKNVV